MLLFSIFFLPKYKLKEKKSFIIPNNTLNHAPFCTVYDFLHLFLNLSLSNAYLLQQQIQDLSCKLANDVTLTVVRKYLLVMHYEVRHENVDVQIGRVALSAPMPKYNDYNEHIHIFINILSKL